MKAGMAGLGGRRRMINKGSKDCRKLRQCTIVLKPPSRRAGRVERERLFREFLHRRDLEGNADAMR
jgi:hypothetical protein